MQQQLRRRFQTRATEVVSVLPEPPDRAATWQDTYDLPYPLLADSDKAVGDEYDQPTRLDTLGSLHDLIGRMPEAVILNAQSNPPLVAYVHQGTGPADRPTIEDLLAHIDTTREPTEQPEEHAP